MASNNLPTYQPILIAKEGKMMADITMCKTKSCGMFYKCYRAQAEPKEKYQAFANFVPEGKFCDMFIKVDKK